ncbi:LTA synthase family protein [uncultured Eubacterium sp.]|uniref:LTA synthase family protein n=1 Tax=uncultured Eubacterium sp. TaxID=165185 RepID=UPI0026726429|nr:alkaline phosphatase family protein [uncultured Eubacterium sp.]
MKEKIKNYITIVKEKYHVMRGFFKETYNKHIIYMYLITAILINLFIEMLARKSFLKGIYFLIGNPYVFICNAVIILMTLSFTLLMKRRFFGLTLISVIWIILGSANAVLLANRVTPFTAVDLMLIDSAFGVINKYFSVFQIVLVVVALLLAVAGLVFMFLKAPKVHHEIKYTRNIVAIIIIWVIGLGAINLGIASNLISMKFGELRVSYYDYGFVYCFTNSLINTGIDKPNTYSGETIEKIVKNDDNENKIKKAKKKPNIIFLQLESFFDMNNLKGITMSENPVPNFEKLMEKYPSGYLNVPIVGAGTVNTEFEVMTGINLDFFGPGEYPFKTKLVDTTCESICYNLKEYGYNCHAIHNNTATFYGRNVVFSNLGYDTFTSIENMNIDDFTPMGWAKDYFLTDYILKALKSTKKQDYIYTISVQGHGSYPTDGDYDYPIKVTGVDDESVKNQYQYYAWQTNEMDKFIGKLIKALKEFGEDTVLIMYGDHLPSFGITGEDLVNGDVYQTQYVIWSNFKTNYTNEDIEAYQLQSKVLGGLNMNSGKINNYTQLHKADDEETYQEGLKNLSYDLLYGDNYAANGENPYRPTEIKLGLNEVKVSSITPMDDELGTIYIYGNYFTSYSKVYINDEKQQTVYIDPNTLMIVYPELQEGDSFSVYQQNSDEHVLTKTEPYSYNAEEMKPSGKKAATSKKKSKKKSKKSTKNKEKETSKK